MGDLLTEWESWAWAAGTVVAAALIGLIIHALVWRAARSVAHRTSTVLDDALVTHCRQPTRYIFPVIAIYFAGPLISTLRPEALTLMGHLLTILLTVFVAWSLIRLTSVAEDVVVSWYDVGASDNLRARRIHTQFQIIKKIVVAVISILGLATVLMSFDTFRQLGAGLLASAGLAGLVIGLAAQKTLTNLLAGIQMAITQPIRLDDVVIVEGEWGQIEEISLTYVVVRIWDLRRLILPISYFLEHPFENWTRMSAEILGTVFLYTDYTVPVDDIREELRRIVEQSPDWNGKVCTVLVTKAGPEGVEVRALVSSTDASKVWNLRCEVREKLVAFLQRSHPASLPRIRANVESVPAALTGPVGREADG